MRPQDLPILYSTMGIQQAAYVIHSSTHVENKTWPVFYLLTQAQVQSLDKSFLDGETADAKY